IARSRLVDVPIVADSTEASAGLLPLLAKAAGRNGAARAAATRDKLLAGMSPIYRACLHLMETTRDALPGAVLVGDSTQPPYASMVYFGAAEPRSFFASSTGYGTLGYALPAAIGAQLAAPDRSIVCVVGDGGLQFTIQELASAREIQVPVIVLLWNNNGY